MKLRSIQVLRAVAACAVVFHHAYGVEHQLNDVRIGAAGVDLFFVISGFIMATVAADRRPLRFLRDRAWRIYPLWLIALAPWLIVRHPNFGVLVSSVTLWPVYGNAFHVPALHVGWTLSFEMLFYVAFAVALATRPAVPLIGFVICAALSRDGNALLEYLGSPLILEFLVGVIIAQLPRIERLALPAVLLGMLWFLLAPADYFDDAVGSAAWLRSGAWGVPAGLFVYSALAAEQWFRKRAFDLPVFLGNASYSIYLFHLLFTGLGHWPMNLIAAVAIGCGAYWFIERPIIALGRRRSPQSHDRQAVEMPLAASDSRATTLAFDCHEETP